MKCYNLQKFLTKDERIIIYKKLDWFDWHIAQIAHNPRIPPNDSERYIRKYAFYGHLDALKIVDKKDMDILTCAEAAKGGHLDVLNLLRKRNVPWDWQTCANAAKSGHLDLLQWLKEQGAPWDETTIISWAALGGQLHLLQWLRKQDIPWNLAICSFAAVNRHLHVLEWCISQGAPMTEWTKKYCHEKGLLL